MLPTFCRRYFASMQPKKVAWFGLGNMGKYMTVHLSNGGYEVHGFDPVEAARKSVEGKGVILGSDMKETVKTAEFIFTNLPNTKVVEQMCLDEGTTSLHIPSCCEFNIFISF